VRRLVLIAVLAVVSLATATTAPAQPCGRGALDDLHDNGKLDHSWRCKCMLDGLVLVPEDSRSERVSMRDEVERHLRAQCTGWSGRVYEGEPAVETRTAVEAPTAYPPPPVGSVTPLRASLNEFPSDDGDTGDRTYPVPWAIVIAGIVSGGLVILLGAAAVRQWRLRP
jgi:hypothetical protein